MVAQSGINIKDEESYLTAYFSKDRTAAASAQSQAVLGSPVVPGASALSAANPYHNPAHYTLGQQGTTLGGGSFIQPPIQQTTTEQFIQEQLSAGLRRQDEAKSHHLNNPFLQGASLKLRSVNRSFEKGVYLPPDGLSDVQGTHPRTPAPTATTKHVAGPGGMSAAAVTSSVIPKDSRTAEILTLLSLAAEARMRGLVESAAALAKGRRAGSQGVVPADWADLAVSNGIEPAAPVDTCARKLESRHGTDAVNASVGKGQKSTCPHLDMMSLASVLLTGMQDRTRQRMARSRFRAMLRRLPPPSAFPTNWPNECETCVLSSVAWKRLGSQNAQRGLTVRQLRRIRANPARLGLALRKLGRPPGYWANERPKRRRRNSRRRSRRSCRTPATTKHISIGPPTTPLA